MPPIHRPKMDQALKAQFDRWQQVELRRRPARDIDLKVITFSREVGSGGKLIAARVAQILDLPFYDREIIRLMERSAGVADAVGSQAQADDQVVERWERPDDDEPVAVPEGQLRHLALPPDEYRTHLQHVMEEIAAGDGGVILGRGGNFILPRERCLRVRVVAPLPIRVEYLAAVLGIPPEDARASAERGDADRRVFTRHYFDADVAEATHYDLVLNMDLYSLDAAVVMVLQAWGAASQIWNL